MFYKNTFPQCNIPPKHRKVINRRGFLWLHSGNIRWFRLLWHERRILKLIMTFERNPFPTVAVAKTYEDVIMARFRGTTMVNVSLTEKDKGKFQSWVSDLDFKLEDLLSEFGSRGYKLGISWIDRQNAWCVSVTGSENAKLNSGFTMSSWSDDVLEAILMSLYKITVVCENKVWEDYASSNERWG